jgi:hypothetical protein
MAEPSYEELKAKIAELEKKALGGALERWNFVWAKRVA